MKFIRLAALVIDMTILGLDALGLEDQTDDLLWKGTTPTEDPGRDLHGIMR